MKSRAAVLQRKQIVGPVPIFTKQSVPAVNTQPMGPDREDEYPIVTVQRRADAAACWAIPAARRDLV
jgi:hypothetical protein